jgi:hypothetical protein
MNWDIGKEASNIWFELISPLFGGTQGNAIDSESVSWLRFDPGLSEYVLGSVVSWHSESLAPICDHNERNDAGSRADWSISPSCRYCGLKTIPCFPGDCRRGLRLRNTLWFGFQFEARPVQSDSPCSRYSWNLSSFRKSERLKTRVLWKLNNIVRVYILQ